MLEWINQQSTIMNDLLINWASHNTHCKNINGLRQLETGLVSAFDALGGNTEIIPLHHSEFEPGRAIKVTKRPKAPFQILFSGHYDTVFPKTHPFQTVTHLSPDILQGPGVLDMKGGIVIMLKSLEAYETFCPDPNIGWTVLLTPDEEIGSPTSKDLLIHHAKLADAALVFEPCLPNGSLVSSRKGSVSFQCTVKGEAAHVGRDFEKGRNAITAISEWIYELITAPKPDDLTINIGTISGGQAVNIVPDYAQCELNIRSENKQTLTEWISRVQNTALAKSIDGRVFNITVLSYRPPKAFTPETLKLFEQLQACGKKLGMSLSWEKSGGVCDGNFIADCGIPTIDTCGPEGEGLHTEKEYVKLNSLVTRTQLIATFLKNIKK